MFTFSISWIYFDCLHGWIQLFDSFLNDFNCFHCCIPFFNLFQLFTMLLLKFWFTLVPSIRLFTFHYLFSILYVFILIPILNFIRLHNLFSFFHQFDSSSFVYTVSKLKKTKFPITTLCPFSNVSKGEAAKVDEASCQDQTARARAPTAASFVLVERSRANQWVRAIASVRVRPQTQALLGPTLGSSRARRGSLDKSPRVLHTSDGPAAGSQKMSLRTLSPVRVT